MNKNKPIKVILLGESGVGKTNIIKRFKYNEFNESSSSTKALYFLNKLMDLNIYIFKLKSFLRR